MMPVGEGGQDVIGAVDVGSNSIKLAVARVAADGEVRLLTQASETVRLGAGVGEAGRLAEDRMAAARQVLARFAAHARNAGATRLVGVATAAVRRAVNGPEFLASLAAIGWSVRLIDGDEEAALAFRGIAAMMELTGRSVIADIGGASTELMVATDSELESARSLTLGSGLLTDRLVQHDPPQAAELAACQEAAAEVLVPLPLVTGADQLIVTGGTGEYLTRLVPGGQPLTRPMVAGVLNLLASIPAAALSTMIDVPVARARVLPAGISIVLVLVTKVQPATIVAGPSGLRMGLILAASETRRPETNFI